MVLGTKNSEGGGSPIRQSIICDQDTLETTKSRFDNVISVHVYSLHRNSNTSVQTLLNTDWSGKYEQPLQSLERRLGIVSKQVASTSKSTEKPYIEHVIPQFETKTTKAARELAKSIICKSDQANLKDAFTAAINNNGSPEEMEVEQADIPRKRPQPTKVSSLIGFIFSNQFQAAATSTKINNTRTRSKQVRLLYSIYPNANLNLIQNEKPPPAKKPAVQRPKTTNKKDTSKLKVMICGIYCDFYLFQQAKLNFKPL
jgi:hypothetical protein